ncbi:MAG: hypothetical protein ACQEQU_01720 [Spirochaetota bacterium]
MMRRLGVMLVVVLLSGGALLYAEGVENVYDLVVPHEYSSLEVYGGLGSVPLSSQGDNLAELHLNFTPPGSIVFAARGDAEYNYVHQTLTELLDIEAEAQLRLASTSFLSLDGDADYESHTLEFSGMDGFYTAGGEVAFRPSIPSGWFSPVFRLAPYGGVGIGRIYSIEIVRAIELMLGHLGVEPTEERIRAAAEVMYTSFSRKNKYTDNTQENYVAYYTELAEALGVSDRIVDVIHLNYSQEYAFEVARFRNFSYGWQARALLQPRLNVYSNSTSSFRLDTIIDGAYADFTMDDQLYYRGDGSMTLGVGTGGTSFDVTLRGRTAYLPENPRWWVAGEADLGLSTGRTPLIRLDILSEGYYLLEPNFTVYGGVSVVQNFTDMYLYAGGRYRIW